MNQLLSTNGKIKYETVIEAFKDANIHFIENSIHSILVWYDTLKVFNVYSTLEPYQIVNRIPEIEYICRKASYITIIQNYSIYFQRFDSFIPQSFVLPLHNTEFRNQIEKNNKRYLIKPDNGSLGQGITFIEPGTEFEDYKQLSIAQEYIDSYLINNTKFDLRVYVLIASISPKLRIFVYREGIARFCSEPAENNNIFSCLTNTAVNKNNKNIEDLSKITKTISFVFNQMKENGINIDELWNKIDNAIILSILPIHNLCNKTLQKVCPSNGLSRSFQILGFDILIDKNLKPWILEVNYRPSLDFDLIEEKDLKIKMLSSAMKIAVPYTSLQSFVFNKTNKWNNNSWKSFLEHHPELIKIIKIEQKNSIQNSLFKKIFPIKNNIGKDFEKFLNVSKMLPIKITRPKGMPQESNDAIKFRLKTIYGVKPSVIKPLKKLKKKKLILKKLSST